MNNLNFAIPQGKTPNVLKYYRKTENEQDRKETQENTETQKEPSHADGNGD